MQSGPGWRGSNATRSIETTRVHIAAWRYGSGMAARGAGAAGRDAGDRRVARRVGGAMHKQLDIVEWGCGDAQNSGERNPRHGALSAQQLLGHHDGNAWVCPLPDRAGNNSRTMLPVARVVPLRTVNERLNE
jgi:hypothetical protein